MLVGRQREKACLLDAMADAVAGRPSLVILAGEAGIGKTRLVSQVVAEAEQGGAAVLAGECRGLPNPSAPYKPLAQALRRLVSSTDVDLEKLLDTSQGAVACLAPDLANDTWAGGQPIGPQRLHGLLLRSLGWLASCSPVLLVLDDIQWADASTAAIVEFLARNLTDQRMLVVVTVGTDDLATHHSCLALLAELEGCPSVRRLDLGRLDRAEVDELVAALGGAAGVPAEAIATRSGGNPMFVEELVAASAEGIELRPSLQELLVARSEGLGGAARRCLRVMALAGGPLSHATLALAAGLPDAEVRAGVRTAANNGLVATDGSRYRFVHGLVAEALAADLLPCERVTVHRDLAGALAATGGAPAEVAYHWLEAGELSEALPAVIAATAVTDRALPPADALAFYELAIDLWASVPDAQQRAGCDLAWLHERAADTALVIDRAVQAGSPARFLRAREHCVAALEQLDQTGSARRAGALHARLAAYQWHLGGNGEAHWAAARLLLPPHQFDPVRVEAVVGYAAGLTDALCLQEALPLALEGLAAARQLRDSLLEVRARVTVGRIAGYLGDVAAARMHFAKAAALAESARSADDVVTAHLSLWMVLWANDRHEEGLTESRRLAEIGDRLGVAEAMRPGHLGRVAMQLHVLGHWDECEDVLAELDRQWPGVWARRAIRAAIAAARGDGADVERLLAGSPWHELSFEERAMLADCRAQVALWCRRPEAARAAVDRALHCFGRADPPDYVTRLCLLGLRAEADRADRARAGGRQDEADRAVRAAQPLLDRLEEATAAGALLPGVVARAATGAAEAARLRGSPDPALWQAALPAWEATGRTYQVAWTQWRTAEAELLAGGSRQRAAARVQAGSAVATRLRLRPLEARLGELVRQHRLQPEIAACAAPRPPPPPGLE